MDDSIPVCPEPLRGIVDRGDVAALRSLRRREDVKLAQPYDSYKTPSLAHRCIDLGHVELLEYLLDEDPTVIATKGLHGAT